MDIITSQYTFLLLLLALVLASSSLSTLAERFAKLPSLPGRLHARWRSATEGYYSSSTRGRQDALDKRLARLEKALVVLTKIQSHTLSRVTNVHNSTVYPKAQRHGKMMRDKCRVSDVVYRLAIGSPRINHGNYSSELAFNFVKGLTLSKEKKALSKACDYACRIPEDQVVKIYRLTKGKPKMITQVQGRRAKVKSALPSIGYSRLIWLSPDVEGNFDHLKQPEQQAA